MRIEIDSRYSMEVDEEDYALLSRWNWEVRVDPKNGRPYARRTSSIKGRKVVVFAHRVVMGIPPKDPREVDHRDHTRTLDNRKANLRVATRSQNNCNRGMRKDNTSGIKGVYRHKHLTKFPWYSTIMLHKKSYFLGSFAEKEEAAEAYRKAALRLHGEFACIARRADA